MKSHKSAVAITFNYTNQETVYIYIYRLFPESDALVPR